ncbi:MAG: glycosyltransferase [Clostridiales bacterium]|nr:glycosyltransferase [Clostridiales bacterium]
MKKLIIVNNNMKVGGVQKSLCNLLWAIDGRYDVTLYLFCKTGAYLDELPPGVRVVACSSLFRYLGVSQQDCHTWRDKLLRGCLAAVCKCFGRPAALGLMGFTQRTVEGHYDYAIAYLQNGRIRSFYGGVNEFVLRYVSAERKIAYLHCDYAASGAAHRQNDRLYAGFDCIAACSDGCRRAFAEALPALGGNCLTAQNFHRYDLIRQLAAAPPPPYEAGRLHLLTVGRLAHEKAIDRAIYAAAYGISAGLPLTLHIVGDGNLRASLQALAEELHIGTFVRFYGEQRNPYRFMVGADLLLVTSYHEAAPMVVEEARCVGLPVLSVETASSGEMITRTGCGWVCGNNQSALNHALVSILSQGQLLREKRLALASEPGDNQTAWAQFRAALGESPQQNG